MEKFEMKDTDYLRLLQVDGSFSKVDKRIADMFITKSGEKFEKIAQYAINLTKKTEGLMLERAMADALRHHGRLK